jgi:hypothetical protein
MHSRRLLSIFSLFLAVVLSACVGAASASVDPSGDAATPEEIVESFYAWVIDWEYDPQQNAPQPPEGHYYERQEIAPELVYHVERTIASFDGKGGYDPLLCAQDIPENIRAGEATFNGDQATVIVTTSFDTEFSVALIQLGGQWKIRLVECRFE